MIPDKERHLYMAINKISEFPKVTPSADDKILIEKNGEGGHINLSEMPVSTPVEKKILDVQKDLNDRITALAYEPGDTTGDAELKDIRKPAAGFTVPANANAGDAVRAQVTQLDGKITELKGDFNEFCTFKIENFFDKSNVTTGFILSDGTISEIAAYKSYITSDFIKIETNKDYTCSYVDAEGNLCTTNRIVVCFFDSNKNPISSSYLNVDGVGFVTFNNQNAKFIRVSFYKSQIDSSKIEKGATYSGYVSYGIKKSIKEDVSIYEIDDKLKNNIIKKCVQFSSDLVDTSKSTIGYLTENGDITTYKPYATTDFITIKTGEKYIIKPKIRKFILFDSYKHVIADTFLDINSSSEYSFVSEFDGYMRFTYYAEDESNVKCFLLREGTFEENINLSQTMKSEVLDLISSKLSSFHSGNVLNNKKWYACGDSFTEWTTEEYDQSIYPNIIGSGNKHYKTYPWWIGARNEMEVVNIANSGMTLAMPENPGTFTNAFSRELYTKIPSDTDYITLMFGINDGHHRSSSSAGDGEDNTGVIPLGNIDDTTNATFYGAWNVVLKYLIENHPDAHIGVIVSIGCDTNEYPIATIECAKKWGIPYLDLDGDYRYPLILRHQTRPNTCDEAKQLRTEHYRTNESNTHPNVKGHERMSYIIENFLRYI